MWSGPHTIQLPTNQAYNIRNGGMRKLSIEPTKLNQRVRGPLPPAGLSEMTMVDEAGSRDKDPASRTATSYSTVASRNPNPAGRAADVAEPSFLPRLVDSLAAVARNVV